MKICILILLLFTQLIAFAQRYQLTTRHITMEDGLPNDYIFSVTQDQEGFIWIATNYGYCRFDGYSTDVYYQQVYTALGGSKYNSVHNIMQDKAGRLWINYKHQIDWLENPSRIVEIYDPYQQSNASFDEIFGQHAPFTMSQIVFLTGTDESIVWIITNRGDVYKFDGTFHKIGTLPISEIKVTPTSILQKANTHTLWLVDNNRNILYEMQENGKAENISLHDTVLHLWTDEKEHLRIAPYNASEIWLKAPSQSLQIQKIPFDDKGWDDIIMIVTDKENRRWCIRKHSIYVFDTNGKLLTFSNNNIPQEDVLRQTIYSVFFDQSGQLWLATNQGIIIASLYQSPFRNYLTEMGLQDVRGIIADENNDIYVNQDFIFHITKEAHPLPGHRTPLIGALKDEHIIWCGMYDVSLFKYDLVAQKSSVVYLDTIKFHKKAYPLVLHKSRRTSRIWVGGYLLLGYLNAAKDKVELFDKYNNFSSIKNRIIQFFYENQEGIWICTDQGLYLLDEQKGIIAQFDAIFPYINMVHLYEDKAGIFWLATRGGGLLRWDRKNNQVQQFTQKEGLSNDVIYAVYEDDYNNIWLPSNYGLMRFDKNTHEVRNYLPKDGIPHQEFNYTSHARASDGRFFFGGLGGVTSFHPKDFVKNIGNEAPFRVVSFKKLQRNTGTLQDFTKDFITNRRIILQPGERTFFLEVALLNYQNNKQNRYVYRVENLEKEWKYISGNALSIGGLPYGNYTLHLKAQNVNGIWAKQELNIPIRVLRPYYLQGWFIILIIMIIGALLFGFFRLRTIRHIKEKQLLESEVARRTATIEQQAKELQALNEQKSHFFLNIAHDLRTPLTVITTPIMLFLEEKSLDERVKLFLQSIQRNANHLLELIESILDLSRLEDKPLTLEESIVNFYDLVHRIFMMYDAYAKMHDILYDIDYQASDDLYLWLDKKKLEKILHNLLSNALKYNVTNGKVTLVVKELEETIQIEVVDTGVGIHPEDLPHIFKQYYQARQLNNATQGGSGIGLAIVSEYSKIMNGTLSVESTPGKGSTFSYIFPKRSAETPFHALESEASHQFAPVVNYLPKAQNGHSEKKCSILVVEDNVELQALIYQITHAHYHVIQAEHGKAALEILAQNRVDCIVTDIMMPQMDGFELITSLKIKQAWQQIPVIVLTARANEQDKISALRMGIDDYIHKPFSPQELLARIANLILRFKNRQKYQRLENITQEALLSADQQWLQNLEKKAWSILNLNPDFTLRELAAEINLSERHLRRKLQEITGMNANDYVREMRLQKARHLLEKNAMNTVSEISYAVGFSSVGYFSKVYGDRFGKRPSEYYL